MSRASTRAKGARGEALARRYLEDKGYRILQMNYRGHTGEIDIIARDRNLVVFVEVKADSSANFGDPATWVPEWKRRRIVRASQEYVVRKGLYRSAQRFDVVTVSSSRRVSHIEDAFRPQTDFFV